MSPCKQRRTAHSPRKQETSATPGMAVQSLPLGEYALRGTTQPPPAKNKGITLVSLFQFFFGWCRRNHIGHAVKHSETRGRHFGQRGDQFQLTAFEIALGVDTFPRTRTTAVDTANCPTAALLHARAAAEPAPCVLRMLRGTCSLGLALAVADFVRLLALALLGVVRWARGESVRALESAGVSVDTGGGAVVRIVAIFGGRVVDLWR
jgi:hypothetical protein